MPDVAVLTTSHCVEGRPAITQPVEDLKLGFLTVVIAQSTMLSSVEGQEGLMGFHKGNCGLSSPCRSVAAV